MALACKRCGQEIAALAGRRCRKCRQLVCVECVVGDPADEPENGFTCIDCAESEAAFEESDSPPDPADVPPADTAEPDEARPIVISTWAWTVFGILLILMFAAIAYFPVLRLQMLENRLLTAPPAGAREAGMALASLNSPDAVRVLQNATETAPEPVAITAAECLGYVPESGALDALAEIVANESLPRPVRLAAEDAFERQRMMQSQSVEE